MSVQVITERRPAVAGGIGWSLSAHRWFVAYVLVYVACGILATHLLDLPEKFPVSLYSAFTVQVAAVFVGAFLLGYPVYVMIFVHPARLTRYMIDDLRRNYFTGERVVGGLIIVAVMPMFVSVFTAFKTMIGVVHPHSWDVEFEILDRWLHGGIHPWVWLQPLLGHPWATTLINLNYHIWLVLLYVFLFWQAFSTRDPKLRMQFFITYVVSWSLLGSLLAMLLSSGGPVYYHRLTGLPDPYAPLMAYLYDARESGIVWALKVQEGLWESYESGSFSFGSGISAMPSMHVSAATLFTLLAWRVNRIFGWAMTVFTLLIVIGAVHLGWHYAIDGYVSILLTWATWRGAGWWVARDPAFAAR